MVKRWLPLQVASVENLRKNVVVVVCNLCGDASLPTNLLKSLWLLKKKLKNPVLFRFIY